MKNQAREEVKRIIIAELPELMKVDKDIRNFILNVTRESHPNKRETESRFDRRMDELKRDREARDKKWAARTRNGKRSKGNRINSGKKTRVLSMRCLYRFRNLTKNTMPP